MTLQVTLFSAIHMYNLKLAVMHHNFCRLHSDSEESAQELNHTLVKLKLVGLTQMMIDPVPGLASCTLGLPSEWRPDLKLVAALDRLRACDPSLVALDLSGSPPEDGDFLALALAIVLVGNTTLTSLELRACGIGALGLRALTLMLAANTILSVLE